MILLKKAWQYKYLMLQTDYSLKNILELKILIDFKFIFCYTIPKEI